MDHPTRLPQPRSLSFSCLLVLSFVLLGSSVAGADDLATKCGQFVQKVIPCLSFAMGKAAQPTKECCDATASIKDSNPECLCYIIQQTHKGSPESKRLGIQEAKLLQLPSACKLNANVTNCPKLLGLPADSPDAAIFKNASSSATPTPEGGATTKPANSSSPENLSGSFGSLVQPHVFTDMLMVAFAVFLLSFPTSGLLSIFT